MPSGFHNGYKIPRFVEGDRERTPQSAAAMNEIVDGLNVLLNPKLKRGTSDSDVIGDEGHVITLKGSAGTSSSGPFSSGSNPTHLNGGASQVLIDTTNGNDTVFVCGNFSALKWGFEFNHTVALFESGWIKRPCLAALYYNMIPRPESWFIYNSTWLSPQPLG